MIAYTPSSQESPEDPLDAAVANLEASADFCNMITQLNGYLGSMNQLEDPEEAVAALENLERMMPILAEKTPDEVATDAEGRIARSSVVADIVRQTGSVESVSDPQYAPRIGRSPASSSSAMVSPVWGRAWCASPSSLLRTNRRGR